MTKAPKSQNTALSKKNSQGNLALAAQKSQGLGLPGHPQWWGFKGAIKALGLQASKGSFRGGGFQGLVRVFRQTSGSRRLHFAVFSVAEAACGCWTPGLSVTGAADAAHDKGLRV